MFYLRQRGIDQSRARALLTYGFGAEVLEKLGDAEVAAALEEAVLQRARLATEERVGVS